MQQGNKKKYVLFKSALCLVSTDDNGDTVEQLETTEEVVEINDSMMNVFATNPRIFAYTPVCEVKFIERNSEGELTIPEWHVNCTVEQSKYNIELALKTLNELVDDNTPNGEKIEI